MKKPLFSSFFSPFLYTTCAAVCVAVGMTSAANAQGGEPKNPFLPPNAKIFYAPDREYDLKNLAVTLDVDWPNRRFTGTAVNTIEPLHSLSQFRFNCGDSLKVSACEVNGSPATFEQKDNILTVMPRVRMLFVPGKDATIAVHYTGGKMQGAGFGQGGDGGFHWIAIRPDEPNRVGFWTQGETEGNRNWAPTWDYPNDFCTSETTTTVPADWSVIGNGVKTSDKVSDGRRTVTWKMSQPHATYLLSLCAGPFDIKEAKWEGVPLLYVVPKGKANTIDPSFSDTPDMLSFYSQITGVKYPWPKYAQNAMYEFGGGMENVSATTLGADSLTDGRDGFRTMASLNSHELGHQWFGDLVTCKDWGQVWLNESFATYMQDMYFEHSRGKNGYDLEIEDNMQQYFDEAKRYKRPIVTKLYPNPDAMFDSHTYPKGGTVLHTLRRFVGDAPFFKGLNLYLTRHRNNPVETPDLIAAMTDASGKNVQAFFEQWVYKPGHPVIDYTSAYDAAKGELTLTIKQTQDTKDGTPIYEIPAQVGIVSSGKTERYPVTLNSAEQTVTLKTAKPDAVLLDPDHDFLRELTTHWQASELPAIVQYAPCSIDRQEALVALLQGTPSDEAVKVATAAVAADTDKFPAFTDIAPLVALKREDLRPLFRAQLTHPNVERQAQAIRGLGSLAKNEDDLKQIRTAMGDTAPYPVMASAISAIAQLSPEEGAPLLSNLINGKNPARLKVAALNALRQSKANDPKTQDLLRTALQGTDFRVVLTAVTVIVDRKDKELIPDIKKLQETPPANFPGWFKNFLDGQLAKLQ